MSNQVLPFDYAKGRSSITIPAFQSIPDIILDTSFIASAESRIIEAKVVNSATYSELEYTFNEGYRQCKTHLSEVGYQIALAKKAMRNAKSVAILDLYPDFLKEAKLKDNASVREAFLQRQEDYVRSSDRVDMLIALETLLEGKIKVFENVCRYMKKEIDIVIRSGIDSNKYVR